MSFLLKKDESLGPKTELSTTMNKKDSNSERDSSPKYEVLFKNIVLDNEDSIPSAEETECTDENRASEEVKVIDGDSLPKNDSPVAGHDLNIFRVSCTCIDCFKYRELIVQLFMEDFEYNTLWDRLQLLIRKFYDIVPEDKSSIMEQKYKSTMSKYATKWLSDGRLDTKKNIQLSLGANLPLSNEMTFVLVFSMLYTRDPHQLFELLCIQMRSIAMAYSEGLKDIIKPSNENMSQQPSYNPIDLLNFILDGYDKICNAAKALSPLLFELQRGHLQKFSLTWNLLNKRVYQRWVYLEVQELIPECILSLKELLDTERYKSMVYRFIKFDDEMTLTTQMWRDVWSLIHDYHMENDDIDRRKRISSVHSTLNTIKQTKFKLSDHDFDDPKHNILEWLTLSDRQTVWYFTVYFLRHKWIQCAEQRLSATIANVQCLKCNFALASHYVDCTCRTCLIAGGPCFTKLKENTKQMCCTKCSFFEKLDRDYLDYVTKIINTKSDEANKKVRLVYEPKVKKTLPSDNVIDPSIEWSKGHSYHLSWAVFKHLPTRQPYNTANFNAEHFCSFQNPPCTLNECRVATHIMAGLYPLNFSKFLIKAYQPLNEDERKELMNIQNLYFTYLIQKLCDDNTKKINPIHAMDLLWNVDDSDYALLCDIGSAFAECYLTDATIPLEETIDSCFLADGFDIELNLYWLECIYMSKANEKSPLNSPSKKNGLEEDPKLKELKELRTQMDKLFLDRSNYKQKALMKQEDLLSSPFIKAECPSDQQVVVKSEENVEVKEEKDENPKGDHIAEAIKLAVNQKLNLKLEAELWTLKKEHTVLKNMVRDLEQIKENEEKQIKVTPDKNGHQCNCCAEHSEFLENHPNKMCHRGDGQCTCYYCTIFGHTECNHGRTNETRDRLRKRLHHQIHSKDSTKLINIKNSKTVHGVYKKSPPSNEVKHLANALTAIKNGIPPQPVVPNNKVEAVGTKRKLHPPVVQQTQNVLVTNTEPKKEVQTNSTPEEYPKISKIPKKPSIPNLLVPPAVSKRNDSIATPIVTETFLPDIQDILEFIEGSTSKKDSWKKAAKKAKQKQKKQDVKKIEELEQIRNDFHDIFFKESDAKVDLKSLKNAKKKDKKKIAEAENNLKKYGKSRSKLESTILELIVELKKNNGDFKFAYLPTKEQQMQKQQKENTISPQTVQNTNSKISNKHETNQPLNIMQQQYQQVSVQNASNLQNGQKQNCEVSLDPSKRMVTIRRVNVPHADPQVTVTAKGASPDKDKLLYTFINGQLVVANSSDANTFKSLAPSQLQQYQLQHQQLRQQNLNAALQNAAHNASHNGVTNSTNNVTNTTNSTIKNERKIKKELNKQNGTDHLINKNNNKFITSNDICNVQNNVKTETAADKRKKKDKKSKDKSNENTEKKDMRKQSVDENVSSVGSIEDTGKKSTKIKKHDNKITTNKSKSNNGDTKIEEITNLTRNIHLHDEVAKKEEPRRIKAPKFEYADPQYKNNKFDVLDLDDDDYYISEEESVSSASPINVSVVPDNKQSNAKKNLSKIVQKTTKINEAHSAKSVIVNNKAVVKPEKVKQVKVQKTKTAISKTIVPPTAEPTQALLSKKQKKKLAQQNSKQDILNSQKNKRTSIDKSVLKAENMAKSLNNSMQRLHLNHDTTIEIVKENHGHGVTNQLNQNVSIMDQLNRGVKVEGLMLPPGITLTRVDPTTSDAVHSKQESIGRICHPMPPVAQEPQQPHLIMSNPTNGQMMSNSMMPPLNLGQEQNGFIMVDTLNINKNIQQQQLLANNAKKNKKNRRKNKNRKDSENGFNAKNANTTAQPNIVTLRNPLFQTANDPMRQLSMHSTRPQIPLHVDQPAAIIKNENGMFTIRNPALHQALSNSISNTNNIKHYISEHNYCPPEPQDNLSFFSDNTMTTCNGNSNVPKHNVAIGSEIKNAQQQKQQQIAWQSNLNQMQVTRNGDIFQMSHLNPQQTRSYSPYDNQASYGFNSDFIGASASASCQQPQNYYNGNTYNAYANGPPDCNSLFANSNHRCDDSPPLSSTNNYYEGISQNYNKNYDDMSFLHNLQPGQRLNSEVTIHNISESKFHRDQQPPLTNGVEITRIPGPPQQRSYPPNSNLAVGSHRLPTGRSGETMGEFGDSIFAPNQTVNLSELESEERDIESFKRFNYYFEPPKNKPKVNLNVKDIVLTKKMPNSDSSSPYFGESASLNSTPTLDDLYHEMNALKLSNNSDVRHHMGEGLGSGDQFIRGINDNELKSGIID